ncbi:hypothetical protein LX36DRAFT_463603 [Colletotrichum falcatum]|nr:hypothetical protein LX36DRAFT_463603 [Colletotrichum falcatum]
MMTIIVPSPPPPLVACLVLSRTRLRIDCTGQNDDDPGRGRTLDKRRAHVRDIATKIASPNPSRCGTHVKSAARYVPGMRRDMRFVRRRCAPPLHGRGIVGFAWAGPAGRDRTCVPPVSATRGYWKRYPETAAIYPSLVRQPQPGKKNPGFPPLSP